MSKKKGIVALVSGGVFASLGVMGTVLAASATCIPCAIPALGYFLAFLGFLGITVDLLAAQNIVFSILGVGLLGTGVYFIRRKQTCAVKGPKKVRKSKK
jgi:LPXTG-motif cell wall-anchored protein